MTIKKRLFWSNLWMLLLPIVFTCIIAIVSFFVMWVYVEYSESQYLEGWRYSESEDGLSYRQDISEWLYEIAIEDIEEDNDFETLREILDESDLYVVIAKEDETIFSDGDAEQFDIESYESIDDAHGDIMIVQDDHALSAQDFTVDDTIIRYMYLVILL